MSDLDFTVNQWLVIAAVAMLVVVIPSWWSSFKSRRQAMVRGYRPDTQSYAAGAVLFSLLPLAALLYIWFVGSGFLVYVLRDRLSAEVLDWGWMALILINIGVLVAAMQVTVPKPYLRYTQHKPKGVNTPLDWLMGLLLTVLFFPGCIYHVFFVAGLRVE